MNINSDPSSLNTMISMTLEESDPNFFQVLWGKVCSILISEMELETFELWVKPVKPLSYRPVIDDHFSRKLSVEVPSKIFADWIMDRSSKKIEMILAEISGRQTQFEILVAKENEEDSSSAPAALTPPTQPTLEPMDPAFSADQFNPKYTFTSFIEGEGNRFAKAAAEGVSKEPGIRFNPLFIYGDVGLGKTHLMHAIGHAILENNPRARVIYTSSEKFINEFINSLRFEKPSDFRNKYRNLDCLLIDDIQFLIGKDRSLEEFFFTFNTLFDSRKQIVISSDRPPKEMGSLQERLISRFEWGVVADIQPADLETRIAILRKKAELERMVVPDDVILFIASQVKSNIRELEGALIRVVAFSTLTATPLTVDSARATLKDIIKRQDAERPLTMDHIQEVVAKHFNLETRDLKSKKRTDAIAWPRQIAMYLARTLTEHSTTEIGDFFGGKDHTTVLHACDKVKMKLAESPFISSLVNKITQEIKNDGTE